MEIDVSLAISITAFILSLITIYFQWFRVVGSKIDLLNAKDKQLIIVRPYSGLPKYIQEKFTQIPGEEQGYALVKLVYGNAGDRAGIAYIKGIKIETKNSELGTIKSSFDRYTFVPAYEIVEEEILLRNIPMTTDNPIEFKIELNIECGGYHPRTSSYLQIKMLQKVINVNVLPPHEGEKPWWTTDGLSF